MKEEIEAILRERDDAFKQRFCRTGQYMADAGPVEAITCSMDANEYIQFMHEYDQKIIEASKKA